MSQKHLSRVLPNVELKVSISKHAEVNKNFFKDFNELWVRHNWFKLLTSVDPWA